jgi:hypothetical protein
MTIPTIVIVKADGWQGLYKDGKLVCEDHRVTYKDLAEALGIVVYEKEADQGWLEDEGNLPKNLSDVKESK